MNNTNTIECSKAVCVPYMPGAADECEMVLRSLGFEFVQVKGTRGSHGAEIYVSEKERAKFDEKVLCKPLLGKYRRFFISDGVHFGVHYYYVSYSSRKYENLTHTNQDGTNNQRRDPRRIYGRDYYR